MLELKLGVNYFGTIDYLLLIGTLLVSLLIGLYYGYKGKHTNEELLVGGRNMSILPVAASVMVTYVSAVSLLGLPSEVYAYGSQIFVTHIVGAVGMPLSAFLLIPFFYPMKLTSINEYLEKRFESKWVRWLGSGIFIFQNVTLASVYLYAPSLALEAFLGLPMYVSILAVGICATAYTNVGGIKAVVWADAFQCLLMLGGMSVICWRAISGSGGMVNALQLASDRGRLMLFDFTFDPFSRHHFWNFLIGTGFHSAIQPGIHQLQVQRYSGMRTLGDAQKAIIGSVPFKLAIMSLCTLTGISIFAFYANCDPYTDGKIKKVDQLVPYYVVNELMDISGIMGIFTASVFSAVLSSLSSMLNSLAAVTWEDFLGREKYFSSLSPQAQAHATRIIGVIYGIICIGLAFAAKNLDALYYVTLAVVGATAGALYGVFIMAMFFPFVNSLGALVGTLSGFLSLVGVIVVAFLNKSGQAMLSFSVDECPKTCNSSEQMVSLFQENENINYQNNFEEWPWKIFHLSYILYPIVGAFICVPIGILTSFLVNLCSSHYRNKKPLEALIHPLVRPFYGQRFTRADKCHEEGVQHSETYELKQRNVE